MPRIIDISPTISPSLALWPGDVPFTRDVGARFEDGHDCEISSVRMSLHTGAHADSPGHTLQGGCSIDQVDLGFYLGPCEVMDLQGLVQNRILPKHMPGVPRAPRILFKTCSYPDRHVFSGDFTALSSELVEHLHHCGCVLLGIDTPSMDPFDSEDFSTHHALAERGMASLEGLVLDDVVPGIYTLVALPLKFGGADGSPVRAVLLED